MALKKVLWGVAPTQSPSISYIFPLIILKKMENIKLTILIADTEILNHNQSLLKLKIDYYKLVIKNLLSEVGIDMKNVEFVLSSSFHYKINFVKDIYYILNLLGKEIKFEKNIDILQSLDAHYCDCNYQLGTTHQEKNFDFCNLILNKLNYNLINNIVHEPIKGLGINREISKIDRNTRIDLYDSEKVITEKIYNSEIDKEFEDSGICSILKNIIFELNSIKSKAVIIHNKKYYNYSDLAKDFIENNISESEIKKYLAFELNNLIKKTRKYILSNKYFLNIYPEIQQ